MKKILIIGGVAGGASSAARLRRLDEHCEIIMFEKGKYISFANCGLPYYIGGEIYNRDALLLQTPQSMKARFNIDVRVESLVTKISRTEKYITVEDIANKKVYTQSYDELIIATGSKPIIPPIPGIEKNNVFQLWNMDDTDDIKSFIEKKSPKSAVVVGGGFIGIEMAENLRIQGINVTIVEFANQVMNNMDMDMVGKIHKTLNENKVELSLGTKVVSINETNGKTFIELNNGRSIPTDMVVLSVGIKPNSQLAIDAGIETNSAGGIVVDDELHTSDPFIYAVGDVIQVNNMILGKKALIPLAGPANKQGRICANNLGGSHEKYIGSQGTAIVKIFDLAVASTGASEKQLQLDGLERNKDYMVATLHLGSHASYYPGAKPMTIKLIFNQSGFIYGAQIIGYEGVDKRIDCMAVVMRLGGTIFDLKALELAYAPPFSSAKDPVNMAGFVAENMINNLVTMVYPDQISQLKNSGALLLDVRDISEVNGGLIQGSIHIPLNELRDKIEELDKNKKIVVICAVGLRGYVGARILSQRGFNDVVVLAGGYVSYDLHTYAL